MKKPSTAQGMTTPEPQNKPAEMLATEHNEVGALMKEKD